MINFHCQHCDNPMHVDEKYAGRDACCRVCRRFIIVPKVNGIETDVFSLSDKERCRRMEALLTHTGKQAASFKKKLMPYRDQKGHLVPPEALAGAPRTKWEPEALLQLLRQVNARHTQRLAALRDNVTTLEQKISDSEADAETSQTPYDELKATADAQQKALETSRATTAAQQASLAALKEESSQVQDDLDSAAIDSEELWDSFMRGQENLEQAESELRSLTQHLQEAETETQSLTQQREAAESEAYRLAEQREEAENSAEALRIQFSQSQEALEALAEELEALKVQHEDALNQTYSIQETTDSEQAEAQQSLEQLEELLGSLERMQRSFAEDAELQEILDTWRSRMEALQMGLHATESNEAFFALLHALDSFAETLLDAADKRSLESMALVPGPSPQENASELVVVSELLEGRPEQKGDIMAQAYLHFLASSTRQKENAQKED